MTAEEKEAHNWKMTEEAAKCHAKHLEWDGDCIVGYGSDADYDTRTADVQNGYGYYDEDGNYRSYCLFDNG